MSADIFDGDIRKLNDLSVKKSEDIDGVAIRPIEDVGIGRLVQQKHELTSKVATAKDKIERLKTRHEDLEKEKLQLETLSLRQDEYEKGKRDLIEKLRSGMVMIQKEELQSTRMSELLKETRAVFEQNLSDIRNVNENAWGEDDFQQELADASTQVDIARQVYEKAMAKIEASSWHKTSVTEKRTSVVSEVVSNVMPEMSFKRLFAMGMAFSLPLMVVIVVVFLLWWLVFSGVA